MSRLSTELLITAGVEGLPHLDRLIDRIDDAGGETDQLRESTEALKREWDGLNDKEREKRLRDLADAANRSAQDFGLLGKKVKETKEELDAISQAKVALGLDNDVRVKQQIEEVTAAYRLLQKDGGLTQKELARAADLHREKVEKLEAELGKVKPTLEDIAVGWGKVVAASAGLTTVVKDAVDFETAMAGVKKVVDGTDAQMAALGEQVKDLAFELGMVPEAVAAIAAQGGQLGIAFADLPEFTRLAGQMSVAFGMTAEESANAAAKIQNVFGITLAEMRALGDAINTLGNNTAAKESEITEAMLRIGGTSKQFGLAAEQAAALADAFIALGKSPEVAATAINALLTKLQTAPAQGKEFQKALEGLGITAAQLADNIRNNPEAAIVDFMARLEQMDKQARAITLTELFGAEYADDISLAAGSLDTLRKAFGLVADKAQTAGAMQREFDAAMATTGAKINQAKVALGNLAKTLGTQLLPLVGSVAEGVGNAANALSDFAERYPSITKMATYLAALKVAAVGVNGAMGAMGVSTQTATQTAIAAFGRFRAAVASGAGAVNGLKAALSSLSTAGIVLGISAAIALYEQLGSAVDKVREAQTQAKRTWAEADIAQTRLNLALSEGVSVQSEYVRTQQSLLKQELAAIDARVAGYEQQIQQAKDKWIVDDKAIKAAEEAIAAERKRRASLQETADKTDELIAKTRAEADAQAATARSKELAAQGWAKLTTQISAADQALLQIPEHSQRVIDGLKDIAQSGAESGETLALAFRQALGQVETREALEVVKKQLTELATAGKIGEESFAALSAAITARFAELPYALSTGTVALKQLGLDAQQAQTGISKAAQDAIAQFGAAATEFGKDADSMARIFVAAARKMSSPEEFAALQQALEQVGGKAGLTAQAIKKIADTAPQAANAVATAFAKIGVDVEAVNQGISASARRAFDGFVEASTAAKDAGVSNAKLIQSAFDNIAPGLKGKEEFAAFNATLRETGNISKLTAEQQKILNAGMRGGAEAAEELRQQLSKNQETQQQNNDAAAEGNETLKANTEELKNNTEALKENAEAKGKETDAEKANTDAKEKAASASFALYDATNLNVEAQEKLNAMTKEWADGINTVLRTSGDASFWNQRAKDIALYADQLRDAQIAIDALNESTGAGTVTMEQISETAAQAQRVFFGLDNTTLNNLNAAIDAARQKLASMKQEAEDTRASLEAQLASLRGDDSVAQSLNEQKRLRELNIKLQEAEAKGQQEIAAEYRRAIELQKQVFDEERRQQQQRKAEEAKRKQEAEQRKSSTSGNRNTSSGKDISAEEVVEAFDERIAEAEKRGANNLALALREAAKRRPR